MAGMILVDVHAHLDYPSVMEDMDGVIGRAKDAGVKVIIANGIDQVSNREVLELAKRYDIIKPALGIYPPDALKVEQEQEKLQFNPTDIESELDFIRSQEIVAVGEIGMDLSHGKDEAAQTDLFRKLIDIAKDKDIPVIVHSRKAELQVIDILEQSGHKKVVLHCFNGRKHLIKRAADLGYSFSIPTNIVRSEHFQTLVEMVHISQILTETDTPYLSPYKDKQNEPAFIIEAINRIAEIKGMTPEDTANNIFMNYQKMF
ncbi:TatD family hydrolase [Candidatus Woesearchaeota archaeon]|nr:TatD family hydrolase [Candidatus Woesearchaeota archaeon]